MFSPVAVCGGLTVPDPGRWEHHSAWDTQVPAVLHSSMFTPWREESSLSCSTRETTGEEV